MEISHKLVTFSKFNGTLQSTNEFVDDKDQWSIIKHSLKSMWLSYALRNGICNTIFCFSFSMFG